MSYDVSALKIGKGVAESELSGFRATIVPTFFLSVFQGYLRG